MSRRMTESEEWLRKIFLQHSTEHPKKHGAWAIFRFPLENTFLSMDTWNGDLRYAVGGGGYEYWKDFNGKTLFQFGGNKQCGDEGRAQPDNVIDFYINKILSEIKRKGGDG